MKLLKDLENLNNDCKQRLGHLSYEFVNISKVKTGDTVVIENSLRTVGKNDIKNCQFMGRSLFGDTFNLGSKKIIKVNTTQ